MCKRCGHPIGDHWPDDQRCTVRDCNCGGCEAADRTFQKVLVARHSPQNHCLAADGDLLYPPPPLAHAHHGTAHLFLSTRDHVTRSKFGWVKGEESFTVESFVDRHFPVAVGAEQFQILSDFFEAVAKLPEGTPVAGSYFLRGVEQRHLVLAFHKVIFAKGME